MLKRKAGRWALGVIAALLPTIPCFVYFLPLWNKLIALGTLPFMFAALGLGLVLSVGPVAVVVCSLVALFLRIEACYVEGALPKRTVLDCVAIATGMLVTFAPALAALYVPVKAILTGYIAFRGPGQQYPMQADPYGFWQAVGFWLMGVATLAFLAGVYWRSRWLRRKQQLAPQQAA
ncbi:hypothetical protein [Uliginosibacterium gangwonense]|uniref:hypothetical protein n=1 Tax=Uliginosibacterium gangwonense TaxID=392736 RepID=UPI0012F8749E|nr:hypothetical protein [Uliginosibacterium gangwonense]